MALTRTRLRRVVYVGAAALIALVLLATLAIDFYMLRQLPHASTSVPFWDQWVFVHELELHERGKALWPILWAPYWGHRLVIPRLLFFANARWGSLGSLNWMTLLVQFAHIVLLLGIAWRMFGKSSRACLLLAAAVVLNQMLSPFQMVNFTWSMQTMFPLVYLGATAAFLCLAINRERGRFVPLILCISAALISSYTMPNGLFVWPVLVGEAMFLRWGRRGVATLAAVGAVVIATYLWHYDRGPSMGMGVDGIVRDPLHAVMLLGFLLAGPLDFVSRRVGPTVIIVAVMLLAWLSIRAKRDQRPLAVVIAVIAFVLASAMSMVAGRLDQRWLTGEFLLASRYYTLAGVFWSAVALFVLYTCWQQHRRPLLLSFFGVLFLFLMFGRVQRGLIAAEDWADFFRAVDATGSALLLDVPDEQFLAVLWSDKKDRDNRVAFLRERHLAMFAEPRASWYGKQISELFKPSKSGRCVGAIEKTTDLKGSWRVGGWAWDMQSRKSPDDILFTDVSGRVIGMGRGGLRHGYIPGFLTDPEAASNSHAQFRHGEWLGYVRGNASATLAFVTVYGVVAGEREVCKVGP